MQAPRSEPRPRRWVAIAVLGVLLRAPLASAAPAAWLTWSAPVECQNSAEVERRLVSLLGHGVDVGSLSPTRVRMAWTAERGWSVRVTVELREGPRDRALDAPTCADAFDVVALSLALVLDPSFQDGETFAGAASSPDGSESLAPSDGTGGAEASGDAGADGADLGAAEAALELPPPPESQLPAASVGGGANAAASATADASGVGRATLEDRPAPFTLSLSGAAVTQLNLFPVPQFGGALALALRRRSLRLELDGTWLASESATLPRALHPVSFSSRFGGLRGCYAPAFGEHLVWAACAGGELGSLGTNELGGESRHATGLWAAAQLSTGPEFSATRWLRAFASARAVAPLLRHRFVLSQGASVHELPALGLEARVGVTVDVTEFGGRGH